MGNIQTKLTPWSNPGINVTSSQDSFAVEILGKTTEGNLIVNVVFSNIPQTAPSRPQYLKASKQYVSSPPGAFYVRLKWLRNQEPDLSTYGIYKALTNTPNVDGTYSWIGSTSDTTYLDQSILMYEPDSRNNFSCPPQYANFSYRITAVDMTSKESVMSERDSMSGYYDPCTMQSGDNLRLNADNEFSNDLLQNYPNPFNPLTFISYSIEKSAFVTLKIYDNAGKEITKLVNEYKDAGRYSVNFNGENFASGVYYYKLTIDDKSYIKRMVLIK